MWAFRPWVGRWIPSSTKVGTELAAYANVLAAVEGNTTFYALPTERTVAKWVEAIAARDHTLKPLALVSGDASPRVLRARSGSSGQA